MSFRLSKIWFKICGMTQQRNMLLRNSFLCTYASSQYFNSLLRQRIIKYRSKISQISRNLANCRIFRIRRNVLARFSRNELDRSRDNEGKEMGH